VRICGCCVRISAGIRVRDGVRISNRVRRRVKLVNYSLITALPIVTSAHPLIRILPVAADPGFAKGADHGEPIMGDWGWSPQQGPMAEPLVGSAFEAESFLSVFIQKQGQKVRLKPKLWNVYMLATTGPYLFGGGVNLIQF